MYGIFTDMKTHKNQRNSCRFSYIITIECLGTFERCGKDKNLAPGVDLTAIARQTPGMSGADLANLLNEGAIRTFEKFHPGEGFKRWIRVLQEDHPRADVSGDHNHGDEVRPQDLGLWDPSK